MGFLSRFLPFQITRRGNVDDPHYWPTLFGKLYGILSASGITVNADNAMQASAVYACVRVLSETVASLPLQLFRRRPDGGKDLMLDDSLYYLLHDSPNETQTSFEHREMYMGHLCLRGNAYDYILRDKKSEILAFIPLNPAWMQLLFDEKGLAGYEYSPSESFKGYLESLTGKKSEGAKIIFSPREIWHKKGLSTDGYTGKSPITVARDSIGLALASEKYQAKFFANATKTSGALKVPGKLSENAYKRLTEQWKKHASLDDAWGVPIMEEGLEWEQMGMTNKDSQFLELRNFQIEDIARIFRVPAVLLQHPDKSSTYASAEQFFLSFVVHTIRPWLVRLEQSMSKHLVSEKARKAGAFVEHKIDGLLRGDIRSRYEAYSKAIQNTWMNPNEVRALENMNPREGGNVYQNPNITPGGM